MTEITRRALRNLRSAARASGGGKKSDKKKSGTKKSGTKKSGTKKSGGKKSRPQKRSGSRKKTTPKKAAAGKKSGGSSRSSSRSKRKQSSRVSKTSTKNTKSKSSSKKSPIAKSTIERLKANLEEERETYVRQAEELAAEAEALMADREPGDTQFDEESGEGDTINVERERDLALSASALQAVEEIDEALDRIKKGTYGICERCGNKIPVARLEAVPQAALCIECKAQQERRR